MSALGPPSSPPCADVSLFLESLYSNQLSLPQLPYQTIKEKPF